MTEARATGNSESIRSKTTSQKVPPRGGGLLTVVIRFDYRGLLLVIVKKRLAKLLYIICLISFNLYINFICFVEAISSLYLL